MNDVNGDALRLAALERENAKLKKINAALMRRVEQGLADNGNSFTFFQVAVELEHRQPNEASEDDAHPHVRRHRRVRRAGARVAVRVGRPPLCSHLRHRRVEIEHVGRRLRALGPDVVFGRAPMRTTRGTDEAGEGLWQTTA